MNDPLRPCTGFQSNTPLTPAQVKRIQDKLFALLRTQAQCFTMHESSSLPRETLNELMASLCYTLGIDPSADPAALAPLLTQDLSTLYAQGVTRLAAKVNTARQRLSELCLSMPNLGSIALSSTIRSMLAGLNRYDTHFFAHVVPGEIDYQLALPVPEGVLGIDYVLIYTAHLCAEMRFIARFNLCRCMALLDGLSSDYREMVCSLFTPIACNAIGLTLLCESPHRLHISFAQRKRLCMLLCSMTQGQMHNALRKAAHALCPPNDPLLSRLLEHTADELLPRLYAACQAGDLSCVFLSFGMPHKAQTPPTSCWTD